MSGLVSSWRFLLSLFRCGHKEAVFFQSHSMKAEVITLNVSFVVVLHLLWSVTAGSVASNIAEHNQLNQQFCQCFYIYTCLINIHFSFFSTLKQAEHLK